MDRATWAIVISTTSAFVSIFGAVWQLVLYRLSGARVALKMKPALLDSDGIIIRGPEKGWGKGEMPFIAGQWSIELIEITVTNVGRAAISISDVSIDFGRLRGWRLWRHTISGVPIVKHGAIEDETFRLDTGESKRIIFDFWQLVETARKRREETGGPLELTIRASAVPAGRRARRSPWRKRWKIGPQQQTLHVDQNIDPELNAYRAFWRSMRLMGEVERAPIAWELILPQLRDGKTSKEISEKLKDELGVLHGIAVFNAHKAYNESNLDRA